MAVSNRKIRPLMIFFLFALVQTILTVFSGIHSDEPYYWDWARFLSFGYFDHPPMVAWMNRLSQVLFGDGSLAYKIAASACSIGAVAALSTIVRSKTGSPKPMILLWILWIVTPLFCVLTSFMTPDLPLFLFWSISLALGYKIVEAEKPAFSNWILLGISVGLGMYSKYTFVLFFPVFAITLLSNRRDLLKSLGPYLSFGIAVILGIPHLLWNHAHNWPAIKFQAEHGIDTNGGIHLNYVGEYLTAQIGLFNPLIFIVMICAVVLVFRKFRSQAGIILVTFSTLFPLILFGIANLTKRGNANWPAMAFTGGIVLVVWFWNNGAGVRMKRFIRGSLVLGLIVTAIIDIQKIQPLFPVQSILNELYGWKEYTSQIDSILVETKKTVLPIMTNSYQQAGVLGQFLQGQPRVYALNLGSRTNHYAFLPERIERASGRFIFVQELSESVDIPDEQVPAFSSIVHHGDAVLTQGTKIRTFGVFEVELVDPQNLK